MPQPDAVIISSNTGMVPLRSRKGNAMPLPTAMVAFLSAGLTPAPTRAEMVRAVATARLSVASYQRRQTPLAAWLACEIRVGGLRENAAIFAVLEAPAERGVAARDYLRRHPARAGELYGLFAPLESPA
jgi:hypothetical protein